MEDSAHLGHATRLKRKKPDTDNSVDESLSMVSTSTQVAITRSADFWYDDGTIVLQAGATQFRVHRSILSTHSTFFAHLFEIPQPKEEPTVEGCQVVCVSDEVKDWEHLLMVMYQPMKAHPSLLTLRTRHLLSILRLGKKYQFDMIYDGALKRLKSELPSSLDDYDRLVKNLRNKVPCTDDDHDCYAMPCCSWNLFSLINAAVELNVGVVFPVAFYLACFKDIRMILNGSETPHDTVVQLGHSSKELILLGRDRVRKAIMETICPWAFGQQHVQIPTTGCKNIRLCGPAFVAVTQAHAYRAMQDIDLDINTLQWDTLCRVCRGQLSLSYSASRKQFWDNLPSYFDLPTWDLLKAL